MGERYATQRPGAFGASTLHSTISPRKTHIFLWISVQRLNILRNTDRSYCCTKLKPCWRATKGRSDPVFAVVCLSGLNTGSLLFKNLFDMFIYVLDWKILRNLIAQAQFALDSQKAAAAINVASEWLLPSIDSLTSKITFGNPNSAKFLYSDLCGRFFANFYSEVLSFNCLFYRDSLLTLELKYDLNLWIINAVEIGMLQPEFNAMQLMSRLDGFKESRAIDWDAN